MLEYWCYGCLNTTEPLNEGTSIVAVYKGVEQYFSMIGKKFELKEKLWQMGSYAMDNIKAYKNHFGVFLMEGKFGMLRDGCILIEPWYDNIKVVHNDTAAWFITTYNNSSGIMDSQGNFINKALYDSVKFIDYSDGGRSINLFKVFKNDLTGVVDLKGIEIIPPEYTSIQFIRHYSDYLFIVTKNLQTGIINAENKELFKMQNCSIENNYSLSGFVIVDRYSKKKGFYGYNGNAVPFRYDEIYSNIFSRFLLVKRESSCKFYYDMELKKELTGNR